MVFVKDLIITGSLNLIRSNKPEYNEEKIEQIEYGLAGLYLAISKTIVIFIIAALLGILKELIIFTLIYNIIRMPSFGMHASNSTWCLIASTTMFISFSYLSTLINIPINIKLILGIIGIIIVFKNSPADTEKRPIINPKRRLIYKLISSLISVTFVILSLVVQNNFWSNCFILSLLLQSIMIMPTTYKIFNQPYDNYKTYTSV